MIEKIDKDRFVIYQNDEYGRRVKATEVRPMRLSGSTPCLRYDAIADGVDLKAVDASLNKLGKQMWPKEWFN